MKNVKSYIFFFVLALLLLIMSADNGLLVFGVVIFPILFVLILALRIKWIAKLVAIGLDKILGENDYIFTLIILATISLFIGLLWYGAGEPVYISAARSVIFDDMGKNQIYTEKVQKEVNKQLMRGQAISDKQVDDLKSQLLQHNQCPKKTVREEIEIEFLDTSNKSSVRKATKEEYVERLNNYYNYDCFASDLELQKFQKEIKERSIESIPKESTFLKQEKDNVLGFEISRTWFFLKAFLLYLFILCPMAYIVSRRDDVVKTLDKLIAQAKAFKESKNRAAGAEGAGASSGVADKAKEVAKEQGGLLMKILSVDIISELVQMIVGALKN